MERLAVLLLLQVTALNSFSHEIENFSLSQAIRKRSIQWVDSDPLDVLRPLRRSKRTWVITTIDVQEEDKGPFPKYAGQLFNNKSFNTSVKYLISGPGVDEPPEVGLFSIEDDANGHVYVHRAIDREKTPTFQVRFDIVYRKTGEQLDRPLFFKIKVKDINDNAPEFSKEEYSVTIRENHSKEEPVFQVTALDKDEAGNVNSQVSYSLSMQMPLPDGFTFNIDPTAGSIFLTGCLDYKAANSFKLLIKASDHGTPQLSSTATVNVAVEDANNHLPVFIRDNYALQISAGQEHPAVLRLPVEDEDSPHTPAWRAKYRVMAGNEKEQFSIETDPVTNEGILSVIKPLDYEGGSEMRLVISVANEEPFFLCKNGIVTTSGLESSNTTVNIVVLQSQRAPRFNPPALTVQKEDSMKPGRVFRRYPATYPDGVPNKIKYELARDPDGWLSVDDNSGILTVAKEFDQESPYVNNSLYTIIVHAIGHGIPPQTGTGTVLLYLSDMSDHMPTLAAPTLDVCDNEEEIPLIIKANSAAARSHSGPFTFELAEDSEDLKRNWKLGRNFGESVEFVMLRSLPQGSYFVPIIIQDRHGFSTRQTQHVRLCFCPDGHTCKDSALAQSAVTLGDAAIAIIVLIFLLLLVSLILLCRFYVSGSKSKAAVPPQEGEQTLMSYNEERRTSLSQAKLDVMDHAALPPAPVEAGQEAITKDGLYGRHETLQERHREFQDGLYGWHETLQEKHHEFQDGLYGRHETLQERHREFLIQTVDKVLGQKLYHQERLEDHEEVCEPHAYAEEGELGRSDSLSSISIGSKDLPADFLNTLGPKFSALEKVCEKRFPTVH